MPTLLPKGVQTKYLKLFWLKIFSICHLCRWHQWCTLPCKYLEFIASFFKKFKSALMAYLGAWGKMIHVKKQKQKISWHCPFKYKQQD